MSHRWIASMILGGMLVVGCEKSEPTAAPATPAAPAPAMPAAPSAGAAKDATANATATTAPAAAPAAAAVDAKTAEAQKLLDEATQYIKDNKLDLADKTITQLEGMKASLPPEFASKIDTARKSLTAAKASGLIGK